MSHYTWHNVTESSRVTTKYVELNLLNCYYGQSSRNFIPSVSEGRCWPRCHITYILLLLIIFFRHAFATLSFVAEIFIFLYVGMDALDIEKWKSVSDR